MDEVGVANIENKFIHDTAKALTKIFQMSLTEVQSLVALLFGSSYPTPARLQDCQNLCAKSLEGNEERINLVLNGDWGKDGEITVLLNQAITKGVVSFNNKADFVQIKKGKDWIDAKMVVADSYEQREILFRQHLASEEGELLKKDIQAMIKENNPSESVFNAAEGSAIESIVVVDLLEEPVLVVSQNKEEVVQKKKAGRPKKK